MIREIASLVTDIRNDTRNSVTCKKYNSYERQDSVLRSLETIYCKQRSSVVLPVLLSMS